ncbi:hypothetical protein KMZ27_22235 [Pseudomonas shirazica]|nr:hypothetical protein [Pseudomonas shirazica]
MRAWLPSSSFIARRSVTSFTDQNPLAFPTADQTLKNYPHEAKSDKAAAV